MTAIDGICCRYKLVTNILLTVPHGWCQVKGFRVTPATHVNIQRWISLREDGLDGDLALPVGLDFPKEDVKLNQVLQ